MSKPKECKECQWHLDFYIEDKQVGGLCTITEKDDKENICPLIEIVRCGECKHKIQALSTEQGATSCELIRGTFYEDFFCKCGERRAD